MNHLVIITTQLLLYHCWDLHLQIFVQLIHQAGEELVSILLLSYIQLPVPHLKNLQHTFAVRQKTAGFLTAPNRRIMIPPRIQLPTSSYLPEVLRHIVLQLALHQVAKQRLDLVEDTFFRLVSVILNGEEGLKRMGI